tara:strand:- start:1201 stop:1416 length:216 start_codon:yes stop_codon:yes gene_type:complete
MPIEIKELVIKATINSQDLKINDLSGASKDSDKDSVGELYLEADKIKMLKREIISECLDNVSDLLRRLNDK